MRRLSLVARLDVLLATEVAVQHPSRQHFEALDRHVLPERLHAVSRRQHDGG